MKKFVAISLVVFVAFQASLVSARASSPAKPEHSAWDTLAADTQKIVKDFGEALGLNDISPEKVLKKIDTDAKAVASKVDEFVQKLKKDIDAKKPEIANALKSYEAGLTKTSEDLKKLVGPDAVKKAAEIQKSFDKNLKDTVAQVNKVIKAVEPDAKKLREDLEASGKDILNSIVDGIKKVKETIEESTSKGGH
ncbi:hypothetical protein WA026_019614 [Henosepilachna vigintioctopunctata]|uniref:Apolipophorin-III n=1 Tax=Henosepilachna vigintioctopunctata TaxID=420089 RepID=A0AAW1TWR4_9CUCU